ncbi:hypothetical protein BU23DRAFT_565848 [Bimuria novae-zelandiae CBS 107.79]|uniref:Uncharacterized protein n=1 Tax=Bimuria novae-zelandiae CBS 107.79 TaxID=1447943 RepID=A0A6A5VG46_9PLEO|nr:hypothetical protein BU23DRAFT_565848 [Bimuria novae-zelandiae CBS 107.79]
MADKIHQHKPPCVVDNEIKAEAGLSTLSEEQKDNNRKIAQHFHCNWVNMKRSRKSKSKTQRTDRELDSLLAEWNSAIQGHKLMDLDLEWKMLLDCIFDARNFETEDIVDIGVHDDSLVEFCLIYARAELMTQARLHWRNLRENDDDSLRRHLDILIELYQDHKITPFEPVNRFLDHWQVWRKNFEHAGSDCTDEKGKHSRPMIHKNDRFLTKYGATWLQAETERKLNEALRAKGMVGTRERDVMARLAGVKKASQTDV